MKRKKVEDDDDYEDDIEITAVAPPGSSKEFSMSLSERVKRRRRQVSYAEEAENSDAKDTTVPNGEDNEFQAMVSRKFASRRTIVEEESGRRTEEQTTSSEGELLTLLRLTSTVCQILLMSCYLSQSDRINFLCLA